MSRRVVISGLGPISGLGVGIEPTWAALVAGRSAIGPIRAFDASRFSCRIGSEIREFRISDYVPKTYRKATKVMARDIEIAVAAADQAARDAGLITKGTAEGEQPLSYPSSRVGAQIGAGLIAAELNELTSALIEAKDAGTGKFDMHRWGSEGINHLTPLWLLKYLPNMLACHVTIIHDAQGPSNTITCAEASGLLSIGESLRVIQRNAADVCFCGGTESKINPMAYLRREMTGQLNARDNDTPDRAVRPFCETAAGTVIGEGGAILILEAFDTFSQRPGARAYAEVLGFGASNSIDRASKNRQPDPQGKGIALAIRAALREAKLTGDDIDMIVPFGVGVPTFDKAEAAAILAVFGERATKIPVASIKPAVGNCGAGASGLDACLAAKAIKEQTLFPRANCDKPLHQLSARTAATQPMTIRHTLVVSTGMGGQNAAMVLGKV